MRNIIIVEPGSTGYNFVEDIVRRGYNPVVLEAWKDVPPEILALFKDEIEKTRADILAAMYHKPLWLQAKESYEETLAMVQSYAPAAILPGAESGVLLANRLGEDLGLPSNPTVHLPAMTRKDGMHEALKAAGLRYIRGRKIKSPEEALAFCEEYGLDMAVVKPLQSASSQGLFLCDSREEAAEAMEKILTMLDMFGHPIKEALIQERIVGREYVVNTFSAAGVHRINDIWVYAKEKTPEGGYVYDYTETVEVLDEATSQLASYALQVAEAVHFQNGVIHGEYMLDEKGPILIEVNCRPMGGGTPAEFLDLVQGQHETDVALETMLDPTRLTREARPYCMRRKGLVKEIIVPQEIEAVDFPLWEVTRRLKSVFKVNAKETGPAHYPKTRDLETSGGTIFMVHDDPQVVLSELELLRRLEKKFFQFLLSDGKMAVTRPGIADDIEAVLKKFDCHGAVLIAGDKLQEREGAQWVTPDTLSDAHKGFDYVILAYRETLVGLKESEKMKLLFDTMALVREGGRVIIPPGTLECITYGRQGAEMLMLIMGLQLELLTEDRADCVMGRA